MKRRLISIALLAGMLRYFLLRKPALKRAARSRAACSPAVIVEKDDVEVKSSKLISTATPQVSSRVITSLRVAGPMHHLSFGRRLFAAYWAT
jgi:hypothetical protein